MQCLHNFCKKWFLLHVYVWGFLKHGKFTHLIRSQCLWKLEKVIEIRNANVKKKIHVHVWDDRVHLRTPSEGFKSKLNRITQTALSSKVEIFLAKKTYLFLDLRETVNYKKSLRSWHRALSDLRLITKATILFFPSLILRSLTG